MASFLESLFGSFTGQPAIDAANQARGTLQGVYGGFLDQNRANRAESLADVTQAGELGRGTADPYFESAGGNIYRSGQNAIGLLDRIYQEPLTESAAMSGNALGLNGPEGNAAATAAFQAGPGYQFALEQGLEGINRTANAAGMGASGNMLREAQTYGQGLANQEYNRWLDNVTEREGLYAPLAGREADFTAEQGKNLAALDTAQADFYNRSFTDEANRRANLRLGHVANEVNAAGIFGPALASTDLAIGAAQQQAGANTINTGLGAIQGLGQIFSPGR